MLVLFLEIVINLKKRLCSLLPWEQFETKINLYILIKNIITITIRDCQHVNNLENKNHNHTELGCIMNSIYLGINHLQNISVCFVRRQINYVIHVLVRVSQLYPSHHVHVCDFIHICIFCFLLQRK